MSKPGQPSPSENPFSTRRVRPGAIPFLFAVDENADRVVARLPGHGWWGQIVGPHGSGKSALVATLRPVVERAGRKTLLVALHNGQRRLPADLWAAAKDAAPAVVIIDGYEQLSRLSRLRLKRFCRRHGVGLLVTAHASVGLPELFRTRADLEQFRQIVDRLQEGYPRPVTSDEVAERFSRHAGDVRETLFDLYDLYEAPSAGTVIR